jgi:hypothetical protein
MTDLRITLSPREIPARLRATCSDVGLDLDVIYEIGPPASGTGIQRRIEALVQLPSSAWLVSIGGLELCFSDATRLSGLAFYANFADAEPEELVPLMDAPPAWLALPGFDLAEDDRFSVDAVVHVSMDRRRGAVRLRLMDAGRDHRAYSLADGLVIWVDVAGYLVSLVAHGIEWTVSTPVHTPEC